MYRIALTVAFIAMTCLYSCRSYCPAPLLSESQDASASYGEEGAVQEPAWTYYERLSLALGCDSGSIGISSDMTLPDWHSGYFVNDNDRLTAGQSYMEYEIPPQFPGGDGAMIKYIYDNLRYPQKAFDNEYQGRVAVMFHVNNDGYVDSAKVIKSKDVELDAEALRIIKSFPRFTPASVNGTDTAWWMAIPVMFKITDFETRRSTRYGAYQFDNGPDYPSEGLYRIVDDNGLIGYADEQGNTVITPRFKFGFPFKDGHAKVTDSGHLEEVAGSGGEYHQWHSSDWYFIDPSGRKID